MPVHVEDWAPNYGSPYEIADNAGDGSSDTRLLEDGDDLRFHRDAGEPVERLAFIDGTRRVEGRLYFTEGDVFARGVAGVFAVGSVLWTPTSCEYGEHRLRRVVIWGSGVEQHLLPVEGGWSWETMSISSTEPDMPGAHLQEQMLLAEVDLAADICREGYVTVRDGPLTFYRATGPLPIVGYVKTHQKPLLPTEQHAQVPSLSPGERTSVFQLGDRYACYTRIANASVFSGPWSGIIRLELPQMVGFQAAVDLLGRVARAIVPFAGVPHRDPRAPQNMQPVGALENHLHHLMGSPKLATRAVRQSIHTMHTNIAEKSA
jgi:hypothetical protein